MLYLNDNRGGPLASKHHFRTFLKILGQFSLKVQTARLPTCGKLPTCAPQTCILPTMAWLRKTHFRPLFHISQGLRFQLKIIQFFSVDHSQSSPTSCKNTTSPTSLVHDILFIIVLSLLYCNTLGYLQRQSVCNSNKYYLNAYCL